MNWYRWARALLFRLDAERAHHWTIETCRVLGGLPFRLMSSAQLGDDLETKVAGLCLRSPIGLAAGFDKSGRALRFLDGMGFGSIEIGSVSRRASPGNPRPRLFRLPRDHAIVVNYGLPNDGAERVAGRLRRYRGATPVGVNLAPTNEGPRHVPGLDALLDDYAQSMQLLAPHAAYVTLNLSCPNTPGLFTEPRTIALLLQRLKDVATDRPVFLKLAPTDSPAACDALLESVSPFRFVKGFQWNLPPGKPEWLRLKTDRRVWNAMPGAVAGPPVAEYLERCTRVLYQRMDQGRFTLLGGGGVFTADDAYRRILAGASTVQIYTALVYRGPAVIRALHNGIRDRMRADGFERLNEAVGAGQ